MHFALFVESKLLHSHSETRLICGAFNQMPCSFAFFFCGWRDFWLGVTDGMNAAKNCVSRRLETVDIPL